MKAATWKERGGALGEAFLECKWYCSYMHAVYSASALTGHRHSLALYSCSKTSFLLNARTRNMRVWGARPLPVLVFDSSVAHCLETSLKRIGMQIKIMCRNLCFREEVNNICNTSKCMPTYIRALVFLYLWDLWCDRTMFRLCAAQVAALMLRSVYVWAHTLLRSYAGIQASDHADVSEGHTMFEMRW